MTGNRRRPLKLGDLVRHRGHPEWGEAAIMNGGWGPGEYRVDFAREDSAGRGKVFVYQRYWLELVSRGGRPLSDRIERIGADEKES